MICRFPRTVLQYVLQIGKKQKQVWSKAICPLKNALRSPKVQGDVL